MKNVCFAYATLFFLLNFGHFGLDFGSFWLTFGSFWLAFGSFWLTLGVPGPVSESPGGHVGRKPPKAGSRNARGTHFGTSF